jgi:WD40 repeat protein
MDAKSLEPRPALSGITHPQGLEWSPDGRWLAFGGELSQHGEGTWLFEPRTGEILRLAEEIMWSLAWSPDGTRIAAIQGTYASSGDIEDILMSEVIVFELSAI